ncbi:extracellular solute-binding protein [Anaeroselena agilis]|uniref:Extracellular solute-binding protein n=1 Tax=Anaeroselena agilis TaxID=3063788 RepID=A0ABU3NX16_9FIRM|nr:extracellular solute-binding protein [Selenomonadales bacterium 4137-cl]
MRRYFPLLLISFLLVVAATAGTFLAGQASRQNPDNVKNIVVYASIPVDQMAALAQEYEKAAGVRVSVVPMAATDLLVKLKAEKDAPRADLVVADTATLDAAKRARLLAPYASVQTDIIPSRFSEKDNLWIGLWYDPVVFAVNRDFLKNLPHPPAKWADLPETTGARFVMTDFLVADEAANLLYAMAAAKGEEETLAYMTKLHSGIAQYAKFLATPSRMTGLGEADIAVTVQSEAIRYIKDGFPLQIIVPADGTAVSVTGAGLAAGAPQAAEAGRFIDWLTGDEPQKVLIKNKVFVIPTSPENAFAKDNNARKIVTFPVKSVLSSDQKTRLLDKWVHTVRLSPR